MDLSGHAPDDDVGDSVASEDLDQSHDRERPVSRLT
jgi:hypothetical protein